MICGNPNVPLIPNNADLASLPLGPIVTERIRPEVLINADKVVRDQYAALVGAYGPGKQRARDRPWKPASPTRRGWRRSMSPGFREFMLDPKVRLHRGFAPALPPAPFGARGPLTSPLNLTGFKDSAKPATGGDLLTGQPA
jgi:hypothetical protein